MLAEMAIRLAGAYTELGDPKRAIRALQGASERAPGDNQILFSLAATYEQDRQYDRAERTFREVIGTDPEHAPALNYLGYMLADRGQKLNEAVTLIQRAVAIDADNPAYLDSLGWAYFRLSRFAEAITPLERAAVGAPKSSVIQDHLGDAYLKVERYEDAAAAFDRALAGDRDGIDAGALAKKRDRARAASGRR
jgi:tetratricopeptide (TPR) repeat protein